MSRYEDIVKDIEQKKKNKENGISNGIPFPFERYREYIPTIDKGMYYGILGGSGTGKSRLMRYLFVYETFKFYLLTGYPLKILYFALEDGWKLTYKKILIHYLWERHGITMHPKYLDSKDLPLDQKYLELIKRDSAFFEKFEENVFIINEATTPNEIYNTCLKAHAKYGKDNHMIAIIDNFANITKDAHHSTEWDAVKQLSRNFIRLELCKKLEWSVIGILQTDMDTEKNTARNVGKGGISAIEPNLGSIGNNKEVARDMFYIFALFNPWRYEILSYPNSTGYNIDILRNRFRSFLMLKNNEGEVAPRLGLRFDGLRELFSEMPSVDNTAELKLIYDGVIKEEKERKERLQGPKKSLF